MVFNFAAFDQGVQASKDDFRKRRAENAALYADYIQSNPDASVDQRSEFAANLAGNSNFLKNALPSRSVMEQNVSRRKTELAQAAADRERKQLNQNITLANTLSGVYGSAYVSGGEEQALSAIKDLAGDVLPEAALLLLNNSAYKRHAKLLTKEWAQSLRYGKQQAPTPTILAHGRILFLKTQKIFWPHGFRRPMLRLKACSSKTSKSYCRRYVCCKYRR